MSSRIAHLDPQTAATPSNTRGRRNKNAQPPIESGAKLHSPAAAAGGVPAILQTLSAIRTETGIFRGIEVLRHLNQKDGFDCPGCAWPDPDGERTANEYCENGAKAVAEEATTKRVTPEFFARWSVSKLSEQSDFWLGKQGRLTHPMLLRECSEHYEPLS
jgi:anaerobic selenocysteine-containing dehydrogenase